ncbi:XVIPCD domain-containing protein [Pseudoxanthomonas sacheonensis]|uniref:Chitinase n=1 Tax=Pseudoxanthomonas sacheonensis TaxID=443615 RepID=A0ABU1RWU9_9GAMM|nr:XVIPCD domain-containing protein [Pseudoxanthomonas sacheonensis]MDR6843251.1 putative chitinase [Pseudoxanthomonas sacheonensis]
MATDRETQLLQAASTAGISSQKELANFMAQVGHESGGLTRLEESFRYTKGTWQIPVKSAMREGKEALEDARLEALQGKPEKLAELMYGGRMGNDEPGDGYKFHGRGYMQLTGKDNYRAAGEALGLDLVKHPELAAEPENAAKIATWYWNSRVPESAREDVTKATHAINGGENGLADRQARFEKWEKALTPELMEKLSTGDLGRPMSQQSNERSPAVAAAQPGKNDGDGVLRHGEKSESIRQLQDTLNNFGYRDKDGRALREDGGFGDRTKEAVQSFQQAHGLKADGVAGPQTLEALKKSQSAPLLSDSRHPDNALYQQAVKGLEQLGPQAFKSRQELENAAGATVFEAKASGLTRIDHVLQSTNGTGLFAVQGAPNDPAHNRVHLDKAQAAAEPLEKSTAQVQQEIQPQPQVQQEREQRRAVTM